MKVKITRDWCLKMALLEGDSEIGAGLVAIDPIFEGNAMAPAASDDPSIAFGRFVRFMRRNHGLSIEKLADDAAVDVAELVSIEDDARHKPEVRTGYQLANFFKVPRPNLMQLAGLTVQNNNRLNDEAARFAARSDPVVALTDEERAALEAFVAVLSEQS
jgi:transcriptional regulator with XRE-family HTH domain